MKDTLAVVLHLLDRRSHPWSWARQAQAAVQSEGLMTFSFNIAISAILGHKRTQPNSKVKLMV